MGEQRDYDRNVTAYRPSGMGARVPVVHRLGAMIIGAFLLVFGLLGFAGGLAFLSTEGERILGMSSNGLLSAISVVVAAVLLWAAITGPRIASTVMLVLGSLFLLSALGNMAVLQTSVNVLAFEMSNVIFSMVVGFVLLVLGAYGRVGGHLPPDSPYARPHGDDEGLDRSDRGPSTPAESAAEHAMREAEIAVVQHVATPEQRRRVAAMAREHTREGRRRVWMGFTAPRSDVLPARGTPRRRGTEREAGGRSTVFPSCPRPPVRCLPASGALLPRRPDRAPT